MSFKRFLIWSSGDPHVWWSGTVYAILKEGIIGNIQMKLFEIWTSGSGGDYGQRPITIAHFEPLAQVS